MYDQPLYNEYAVHSLEHGAVWITYRPDLGAEGIAALKTLVDGRPYTLLSPYEGLPAPVVASAWNAQVQVQSPTDGRLKAFLDKYEQGPTAPERGAACSGGTARPAEGGAQAPVLSVRGSSPVTTARPSSLTQSLHDPA